MRKVDLLLWLVAVPLLGCGVMHTRVAKEAVESDGGTDASSEPDGGTDASSEPDAGVHPDAGTTGATCASDADCEGDGVVCLFSAGSCDSRLGVCVYDRCSDPSTGLDCDAFPVFCSCEGETVAETWGSKVTGTQLGEPFAHFGACLADGQCWTSADCTVEHEVCLFWEAGCGPGSCDDIRAVRCRALPTKCGCDGSTFDPVGPCAADRPWLFEGSCEDRTLCRSSADCTGGEEGCRFDVPGCGQPGADLAGGRPVYGTCGAVVDTNGTESICTCDLETVPTNGLFPTAPYLHAGSCE